VNGIEKKKKIRPISDDPVPIFDLFFDLSFHESFIYMWPALL
jgi:hypothetical protein